MAQENKAKTIAIQSPFQDGHASGKPFQHSNHPQAQIHLTNTAVAPTLRRMRENTDVISLSPKPALWRVRVVDDLFNPKMVRNLTVSGPRNVREAVELASEGDGWEEFEKQFPNCAVAVVEFSGVLDNA